MTVNTNTGKGHIKERGRDCSLERFSHMGGSERCRAARGGK
jgi:hypothetical protein